MRILARASDRRTSRPGTALVGTALMVAMLTGCGGGPQTTERAAKPATTATQVRAPLPTMIGMAEAALNAGDGVNAALVYERARQQYPDAPQPLLGLAELYEAGGKPAEAAASYRAVLEIDATNRAARHGLARNLMVQDQAPKAMTLYEALLADDLRDHRAWNGKGVAHDYLEQHAAAAQSYRAGLEIAPENVSLRNNLGLSLALAGDFPAALKILRELAGEADATERARQNLALVLGMAGQSDAAAQAAGKDLNKEQIRHNLGVYDVIRAMRAGGGKKK